MKNQLFFAVVLGITLGSYAGFAQKGSPEKRAEHLTAQMQTQLGLSNEQVTQLKPLNLEKAQQQEEWKTLMTSGDRKEAMTKRRAYLDTYEQKLRGILKPEQFEKYQQQQKEQKGAFKEKRKGKV
jgi:hypothetical protein